MMLRPTLGFFAWILLVTPSFAGGTVTWPQPPPPAGSNPAIIPAPRLEWFSKFQQNLDNSRKMPQIDLIFDGDSITDGWQSVGKQVWQEHYAKLNAFDFGISGDRTENLLWRLDQGQLDNLHPKLVVLLIGTNNIGARTPQQIADGIKAIIDGYQKRCPDATILLQAIFPHGPLPTDSPRGPIKQVNELISHYADGKKVIYIDFADKFLQPDGTLTKDIMPDFLHPSEKGYEIWANAIQSQIDAIFPPQPK